MCSHEMINMGNSYRYRVIYFLFFLPFIQSGRSLIVRLLGLSQADGRLLT
jgi:hypothetical protein